MGITVAKIRTLGLPLVVVGAVLLASPALADTFGFEAISNNSGVSSTVAGQLSVNVTSVNATSVLFTFTNNVGTASSITDVYFDDLNHFTGIAAITQSAGVSFSEGAAPPNLPGGNTLTPSFTATFSADSNSPVSSNGVNSASEWLGIRLTLGAGQTFNTVLAGINSGDLRIGLHVQAIGTSGNSDAFVNTRNTVPEPASVLLLGSGLLGIGLWGMNRRKNA